jgi:hypothetical protein
LRGNLSSIYLRIHIVGLVPVSSRNLGFKGIPESQQQNSRLLSSATLPIVSIAASFLLVALTRPNIHPLAQTSNPDEQTWTITLLRTEPPLQSPSHRPVRAQAQARIHADPSKSGKQATPTYFLPVRWAATTALQHEKPIAENLKLLCESS